MLYLDII